MAIGKASDFVIYQEQFFGGMVETLEQNVEAFNQASAGALQIVPRRLKGNFEQESFFQKTGSLVTRRDTTSTSTATDIALTQDENIGVKLNRKIGPVANTLDSFKKLGESDQLISFVLGQQMAPEIAADYLNRSLIALDAALSFSGWTVDETGGTIVTADLVTALAKLGDQASRVRAWVMHSKPFYDLVKEQIAAKITNIADVVVMEGSPVTLGRPVVVSDSSALVNGAVYTTLGLVPGASRVDESEDRTVWTDQVTGLENLVMRLQGEYAFNLRVRGFKWDTANGGVNPDDTALGTQTNWDKVAADNRSIAGVRLITD